MPVWATVLISIAGGGGLFGFLEFLISRKDGKKGILRQILDKLDELSKRQDKAEKDALRTQILLMISDYPHEHQEILLLAHKYFVGCRGNWYLTSIFENYLKSEQIPFPNWFAVSGSGKE